MELLDRIRRPWPGRRLTPSAPRKSSSPATLAQAGIGSGIVTADAGGQYQWYGRRINREAPRPTASGRMAISVDEAQELTAMDWRMLIRRCPSRSFTIVGAWCRLGVGGTRSWRRMMDPLFGERNW